MVKAGSHIGTVKVQETRPEPRDTNEASCSSVTRIQEAYQDHGHQQDWRIILFLCNLHKSPSGFRLSVFCSLSSTGFTRSPSSTKHIRSRASHTLHQPVLMLSVCGIPSLQTDHVQRERRRKDMRHHAATLQMHEKRCTRRSWKTTLHCRSFNFPVFVPHKL
ncbi:unnamed protein product [Victoria cruziana]